MSQKLPALTPKDLLRVLERVGFYVHHATGSHYVLKHKTDDAKRVTLPWHSRDLKRGTLGSILRQSWYFGPRPSKAFVATAGVVYSFGKYFQA